MSGILLTVKENMSDCDILSNVSSCTTDETDSGLKQHEVILIAVFAGLLAIITMIGNLLVMISFGVNKKLRILNNYFLVSLSIADFSIGLVSMPLYTVYIIVDYWPFGALPCDLWLSLDYGMSNASALHLLLICIDRFLSINRPLTYRVNRTSKKVLKMIISIWIISALLWPPWIFAMPYIEGTRTVPEKDCYIQFLYSNDYVTITTHILAFWLPICLMIGFYQRVYHTTQQHKDFMSVNARRGNSLYTISNDKAMEGQQNILNGFDKKLTVDKLDRKISNGSIASNCSSRLSKSKGHSARENDKAAHTLSAILLGFIITWMPYHVNVIISCFCPNCVPAGVYHFGYWLCYINSTVNPFLYALCNTDFRRTFIKIMSCNCKKLRGDRTGQSRERISRSFALKLNVTQSNSNKI